jgi:hypothetical protein
VPPIGDGIEHVDREAALARGTCRAHVQYSCAKQTTRQSVRARIDAVVFKRTRCAPLRLAA